MKAMIEGERVKYEYALISRFGGIGDIICLFPIAKYIRDKLGLYVHYAINENLAGLTDGLDFVKALPTRRIAGIDMVQADGVWYSLDVVRQWYRRWIEFKYSIEANSMYRHLATKPERYWLNSQNSNYVNWFDMWYAWMNVDPRDVPDEYKRPILAGHKKYLSWAEKQLKNIPRPIIMLQGISSALPRTIYRLGKLAAKLSELGSVLVWNGREWEIFGSADKIELSGSESERILRSAALVKLANAVVAADSGISHISEAVGVPHVTTYTTVPPWTRNLYYRYEKAVVTKAPCAPCFSLERGCPLIQGHPEKFLSDREKVLKQMLDRGVPPHQIAEELNTHVGALNLEIQALRQRLEGLRNIEPECIKRLDHDEIYVEVARIVC